MWKKIVQFVHGKDCELRERMLRSIILVGAVATVVAITEIFLVMEVNAWLLTMLFLLLLVMGFSFLVTFKYRKYDLAAVLLGVIIATMVMPFMFIMSGAIESGASVWLVLGILYIFVMFSGKKLIFFSAHTTARTQNKQVKVLKSKYPKYSLSIGTIKLVITAAIIAIVITRFFFKNV